MRVKITYIDSHFNGEMDRITWDMPSVDAALARWYALHYKCNCRFVNASRT